MSKVRRGGCQNVHICEAGEEASLRDILRKDQQTRNMFQLAGSPDLFKTGHYSYLPNNFFNTHTDFFFFFKN